MNWLMVVAGLYILTALIACAIQRAQDPQERPPAGKVHGEIKAGMTTAQVVEVLGSPNIVTTDDKRRESWVYDQVSSDRVETSRYPYGTLIILGGSSYASSSSTRQRTLTIVIIFDQEKNVRDIAYDYSLF